jgi:hypothetical protein
LGLRHDAKRACEVGGEVSGVGVDRPAARPEQFLLSEPPERSPMVGTPTRAAAIASQVASPIITKSWQGGSLSVATETRSGWGLVRSTKTPVWQRPAAGHEAAT